MSEQHRLILGDCLAEGGLASLPDKSVGVTLCDPPYEQQAHMQRKKTPGWRAGNPPQSNPLTFAPIEQVDRATAAAEMARVSARWILVFCQVEAVHLWREALESAGAVYRRTMVWIKPDGQPQLTGDRPGMGYESIVVAHAPGASRWNAGGKLGIYSFVRNQNGVHPTQKPEPLMEALVSDFTDPGELVLDPFAGSGTTGVACKRLGRNFIGWEKDPKFHAAAVKRIEAARQQGEFFARGPKPKQTRMLP